MFAALGLIPLTSAPPHERLLMHVGIALWMLLAHFLVAVARAADRYPKRPAIAMSAFLCVVLLIHLGLAPIALAVGSGGRVPTAARVSARILDEDPTCWSGYLVFVNVASQASVLTLLNERARERLPQPILSSALGVTDQEVEVKRLDARTLELYSRHGYLLDPFANSWRGPSVPLRRGERVGVLEYEIEVLELTSDRRPSRIRARFARVLEDPVLCFAYWNGRAFAKFPLGAFGETHIIAGASDLAGQRDAQHR
jgi:hypothetical protein